jgi:hypothetical protein
MYEFCDAGGKQLSRAVGKGSLMTKGPRGKECRPWDRVHQQGRPGANGGKAVTSRGGRP